MADWQESKTVRIEAQRRRVAEALKRCPLCEAINAMSNEECFACSWHGVFDHDPEHVEEGLDELMFQCPELVNAMMDIPRARPTIWTRIRGSLQGLRNRLIAMRYGRWSA